MHPSYENTSFSITGSQNMFGEICVSGGKNSSLAILAATLLTQETTVLLNVPNIVDVQILLQTVEYLGVKIKTECDYCDNMTVVIQPPAKLKTTVPQHLCSKIRASILLLGPLLSTAGFAALPQPGGCNIGARPIDLHLYVLKCMGAKFSVNEHMVIGSAKSCLKGSNIQLPVPSIGATENAIMAAVLANGTSVIHGAACDPEIVYLAEFLNSLGAEILNVGTNTITINGVDCLCGGTYTIRGDRIEAGSFACLAAATNSDIRIVNVDPAMISEPLRVLQNSGLSIYEEQNSIKVNGRARRGQNIVTMPYPGFPTDLQAPFSAMFCTTPGYSSITETVFENRFDHLSEMMLFGARVAITDNVAHIYGVDKLKGAEVSANNLVRVWRW